MESNAKELNRLEHENKDQPMLLDHEKRIRELEAIVDQLFEVMRRNASRT